ncbi:patched domain-containing protein 3-like [Triplophysa rosa]|uniref:patched domain-containing protein 3-like n=1 Tax=Triplophysa rosa TaxID=992332 RepID=UPI002545CAE3|nr:patched domain-containing protein 3-like [Triplophysa rosa]
MPKCKTNCIERPLSLAFEKLGRVIGSHPCAFLLASCVTAALGTGFIFLSKLEANNIEDQFTPVNGPAKLEREIVRKHLPQSEEFSLLRLLSEGTYASLIITDVNRTNILTDKAFKDIIDLDRKVKNINVTFEKLCARRKGKCMSNPILDVLNYNSSEINSISIKYPMHDGTFMGTSLGGVDLKAKSPDITTAKAVRLFYFLNEKTKKANSEWLDGFLEFFSNYSKNTSSLQVSYLTSESRQEELEATLDSVIPLFSITYCLAISIAVFFCLRLDCVRTKVWIAVAGVLSAGMAVLVSFGLLLLCGTPFSMTVATVPFLILGIGVDDMFIMIACWQKTRVDIEVEERLAETYKEGAVSITITTLTDVLSFYIGLSTPFRSVQSFCLYASTAILFCYVFNITFFGACLALNGRREKGNKHWLTCMEVPKATGDNATGNICCVGGAYNENTGTDLETPMDLFFKKQYGPFLTKTWVKVFVCVIYSGYLAVSIYGCFQLQEGLDLKNLAADGSYVSIYYDDEDTFFSNYGPNIMLVMTDERFQYWNSSDRDHLDKCLKDFMNLSEASTDSEIAQISWLHAYKQYGKEVGLNLNNEIMFKRNLTDFMLSQYGSFYDFDQDVNFTNNQILASRMFIQTVNISTAVKEKNMLRAFRETAENCEKLPTPINLTVYHPMFIYFDQYAVIVSTTIQNVIVTTCAMLLIALLLIPNPICSAWVTFAIASVFVGVAGFMALWGVSLDSISMIILIICIGFSVDFSAHISYAFVSSKECSANDKAIDAIYNLGYPVIQGAVSTIAGVIALAAAESYIFRTFFKIMFLVILIGAVHGIAFIPVFLTFFGTCGKTSHHKHGKHKLSPDQSETGDRYDQKVATVTNQNVFSQTKTECIPQNNVRYYCAIDCRTGMRVLIALENGALSIDPDCY